MKKMESNKCESKVTSVKLGKIKELKFKKKKM